MATPSATPSITTRTGSPATALTSIARAPTSSNGKGAYGYDIVFGASGHYSSYTSLSEAANVLAIESKMAQSSTTAAASASDSVPRAYDLSADEIANASLASSPSSIGNRSDDGERPATSSYWQLRFEEALNLPVTSIEHKLTKVCIATPFALHITQMASYY
jgi:hypothetical protein